MSNHDSLFQPLKIGGIEIKNRYILCAMEGTNLVEFMTKYEFNHNCETFYKTLAENNVGLLICGMVPVKGFYGNVWLYQQEKMFHENVRPLMDTIHSYGSKFFMQLGAGMGRSLAPVPMLEDIYHSKVKKHLMKLVGFDVNKMFQAPTADLPNVWDPSIKTVEMKKEDIYAMIDAYGKTAKLAKECGVDGIEIHAVHEGYLLDQFAMALTNKRTDEFGGSLENRLRFTTEIIKSIKKYCGDDYPVSVRFSVNSMIKGFNDPALPGENFKEAGRDRAESAKAVQILEAAGADLINADNGTYDSWFWAHPPVYMPLACNLSDAAYIKQFLHIPVACAGRMEDADTAAKAVADGEIDGVGIARQFLCDPEFVTKVKEGREDDIRPCIACHNGCFGMYAFKGVPVGQPDHPLGRCALNPVSMQEKTHELTSTRAKRSVAVVGGGIGGMEAARVCALRGFTVDLYEKSDTLGGVFIAAAAPAFKEKDKQLIQWYIRQMDNPNITLHMDTEIKSLADLKADEIIVATGAAPRKLPIPGVDGDNVMEATEYLLGKKHAGTQTVIIGGGLTGCEIAYDLVLHGKKAAIVEMQDDILKVKGLCAANSTMLRTLLKYYKVPVYTESSVQKITADTVTVKTPQGTKELKANSVITSAGYIAGTAFGKELPAHVHVIGDADKVGNLEHAIWQAYDVAQHL